MERFRLFLRLMIMTFRLLMVAQELWPGTKYTSKCQNDAYNNIVAASSVYSTSSSIRAHPCRSLPITSSSNLYMECSGSSEVILDTSRLALRKHDSSEPVARSMQYTGICDRIWSKISSVTRSDSRNFRASFAMKPDSQLQRRHKDRCVSAAQDVGHLAGQSHRQRPIPMLL